MKRTPHSQMNRKIIEEYNIIRVLATIFVVIGHAGHISPMTDYGGIEMFDYSVPIIQKIIDMGIRLIYSFHMPLFFALSGALFHISIRSGHVQSFGKLLANKSQRLLFPFVICSVFWNIPIKYFSGYWSESSSLIKDIVIGQLFLAGNSHLWFLWSLFVITILSYFLRNYDQVRLIVAIVLYLMGGFVNVSIWRIQDILLNFLWFECGILFEKNRERIWYLFSPKRCVCVILSMCTYLVALSLYLYFIKGNIYAYGIVNLCGIVCMLFISLLLRETNIMKCGWYTIILKHSFYIYLVADALNYPILALIKQMEFRSVLETNVGAGLLFLVRIFVPICVAVLCERAIGRLKVFLGRKHIMEG